MSSEDEQIARALKALGVTKAEWDSIKPADQAELLSTISSGVPVEHVSVAREEHPSHNLAENLLRLAKHFSWADLVVFLASEGVGVPNAIGGGEAFVHEQWRPAIIGFGTGLPLMALGFVSG